MIKSFLIAIVGIVSMMLFWALVQKIWGNMFSDIISDEDVLAGRSRCGNCNCTNICKEK